MSSASYARSLRRPRRSWLAGWRARVVLLLTFLVGAVAPVSPSAREGEVELGEECDEEGEKQAATRPQPRATKRGLHRWAALAFGLDHGKCRAPASCDDDALSPRWQRPRRRPALSEEHPLG